MSSFNIDFFELSFLAEACIPPRPIARAMFWNDLINKHYHTMSPDERKRLFDWISGNQGFDKNNNDCQWFYARFNPDNQYLVYTEYQGKKDSYDCFRLNERYYTGIDKSIVHDYITKTERKNEQNETHAWAVESNRGV